MRRFWILIASIGPLLLASVSHAEDPEDLMAQTVAQVGDEIITGADYQRDLQQRIRLEQMRQGRIVKPDRAFRLQTLEERVNALILRVLVRNAKIDIGDEEIQAEYDRQRRNMPPGSDYSEYLDAMNMTEQDLRQELELKLQTRAYIERAAVDIVVSEEEKRARFETWEAQGRTKRAGATVTFRHIFVRTLPGKAETDMAARAKVDEVRSRIESGEEFGVLAKEYSDDTETADRGGLRREAHIIYLPPEISAALSRLEAGELSEPVSSRNGWHLLKLVQVFEAGDATYDEIEEQVGEFLLNEKKEARIKERIQNAQIVLRVETNPALALKIPFLDESKREFPEAS